MGDHKGFTFALRGYDTDQVDALVERVDEAGASSDGALRAAVRAELIAADLPRRLRGYDREAVDDYLRRAVDRLA